MHTVEASDDLHPMQPRAAAAILALFLLLAVFHTWPLASGPGSFSRHDNSDAMLNEWILAWVAHQIVADPAHLFDANIFYPEPNTLAFSEHLLFESLLGAPLQWAGAPTLAVHNVVVIFGFALTGWATAIAVRLWTGDWWAAILGGMLMAFNAYTLTHLAQVQSLHIEFLPMTMLMLDRALVRPRLVTAIGLALAFVCVGLTSNYLLVFTTLGLVAAALMRTNEWLTLRRARTFGFLCVAGTVAVLLLAPILVHYRYAQQHQGLTRSLPEIAMYAATWRDYLAASGRLHYDSWSGTVAKGSEIFLFPGVTALVLAAAAAASGSFRSRVVRMWFALGVVGVVLSFGTSLPGYEYLYRAIPLLQGIRVTRRFGVLLLAGVAVVAAFGLAGIRQRVADRPRLRLGMAVAGLLLVTLEAARLPLGFTEPYRTPALYASLSREPEAVIVEIPLYTPSQVFQNGRYLLHATYHWKPMLNGYSGFMPASYAQHAEALDRFPEPSSLDYLRRLRVTHLAINGDRLPNREELLRQLDEMPGLKLFIRGGPISIYRLDPAGQ